MEWRSLSRSTVERLRAALAGDCALGALRESLRDGDQVHVAFFGDGKADSDHRASRKATVEGGRADSPFHEAVRACSLRLRKSCGFDVQLGDTNPTNGCPDGVVVQCLTEMCRVIRNLCVEARCQEYFGTLAESLLDTVALSGRLSGGGTDGEWIEMVRILSIVAAQSLVNMVVKNELLQGSLWSSETRGKLGGAIRDACSGKNDRLLQAIVSFVYTCVVRDEGRRGLLSGDAFLMLPILEAASFVLGRLHEHGQHATTGGSTLLVDIHATCVWIVGKLVDSGYAASVKRLIHQDVDHEAVLDLTFLSLWMGHRLEEEDALKRIEGSFPPTNVEDSFACLEEMFRAYVAKGDSGLREKGQVLTLRLIGSYAMDERVFLKVSCKRDLLVKVLGCLSRVTSNEIQAAYGLRGDLLRIIANLCYTRKCHQDIVHEHPTGLYTVLNQCNVDENSPYLREWAILAIRNLCAGNSAVQESIAKLRIEGTVNSSIIEKAGMRVEMTSEGKPKLVRI